MELLSEVFLRALLAGELDVHLVSSALPPEETAEKCCYATLQRIKCMIEDQTMDESTCIHKIKELIHAVEAHSSDGGAGRDFV